MVVSNNFFIKIKKALDEFAQQWNDVRLRPVAKNAYSLVLLKPVEGYAMNSNFKLLISAPWMDSLQQLDVLKDLTPFLKSKMGLDDFSKIYSISLIHSEDPMVQDFNALFDVDNDKVLKIDNIQAGLNFIENGYLLVSHNFSNQNA